MAEAVNIRSILVGALGGEGGGVLMDWIVHCARMSGLAVQATSVPGVAQRTGSTSYYIEMCEKPVTGPAPVFALIPMPGRVDFVAASEFVEAARMMERGFVSPTRTVLIASTSRAYTTVEKMQMGDGRFNSELIMAAGRELAKRLVTLDLDRLARESGTVVSASLFGSLAGVGAFPWDRATCEAAIGSGAAARASRAGFNAAFEATSAMIASTPPPDGAAAAAKPALAASPKNLERFAALPPEVRELAELGYARCIDYQDAAYADPYASRLLQLAAVNGEEGLERTHALAEAARRLALWMTYEDISRVADLKTRAARFAKIRAEAEMSDDQILTITEYLKPGADEIAAILPARLGAWFMRRVNAKGAPGVIGRGLHVATTSLHGYFTLRALAQFRRSRRASLRFGKEQVAIETWLSAMRAALAASPSFAAALAELPRLLKGYGETQARGQSNYDAIVAAIVTPAAQANDFSNSKKLRAAIGAALADPDRVVLTKGL